MEPHTVAYVVCSSLCLLCICAQSYSLIRSAISLEQAERRPQTGIDQLRPPAYILRTKQSSPIITAVCGLAYCCCNVVLRSRDSTDSEHVSRIVLAFVVLFGEGSIVAELAHLSWPKYSPYVIGLLLSGVTACGIGSIVLRILARKSHERYLLALWVPPALSSAADGCLLAMQIHTLWKNERAITGNMYAVAAVGTRQFALFPYWTWVVFSDRPMATLVLQHIQILVLIQDPRDWPRPIWKRRQRQKVAALKDVRERSRQSLPGAQVAEGESTRYLVSPHGREA